MYTCFDGVSEDRPVSHIADDWHSVDGGHFLDAFRLSLVLLLDALVDALLSGLELSQH